jgi:hypothetical protein
VAGDGVFALLGFVGCELAEELPDLVGFEVEPLDLVIDAAALDGGPIDGVVGGGAEGVPRGVVQ